MREGARLEPEMNRNLTEILDTMTPAQMRRALAFISGYDTEAFEAALLHLARRDEYSGPLRLVQ